MNILISNDDGVNAPGLKALLKSIPTGIDVVVAAPAEERSASSHSISLRQKLKIRKKNRDNVPHYAVHGTPADSVKFALAGIPDFKPDLVLSGINQGANTGVSVYYSGTLSAAREGFINHIPAIAISLTDPFSRDFSACMGVTKLLIEAFQEKKIPTDFLLNVNVPPLPFSAIKGIKMTKQANSRFVEEFVKERDDDEEKIYTLAGRIEVHDIDGTSDEEAIEQGYISVTPLRLDMTDHQQLSDFEGWAKKISPESRKK